MKSSSRFAHRQASRHGHHPGHRVSTGTVVPRAAGSTDAIVDAHHRGRRFLAFWCRSRLQAIAPEPGMLMVEGNHPVWFIRMWSIAAAATSAPTFSPATFSGHTHRLSASQQERLRMLGKKSDRPEARPPPRTQLAADRDQQSISSSCGPGSPPALLTSVGDRKGLDSGGCAPRSGGGASISLLVVGAGAAAEALAASCAELGDASATSRRSPPNWRGVWPQGCR